MEKLEGAPIAFAFWKGPLFMGYRQDTFGSIGNQPKIYTYSKEQVDTCLKNITYNVLKPGEFGKYFGERFGRSKVATMIANHERQIHTKLTDEIAFEVRVVLAPELPMTFDVDKAEHVRDIFHKWTPEYFEEVEAWKNKLKSHKTVETHYFNQKGLVNLS